MNLFRRVREIFEACSGRTNFVEETPSYFQDELFFLKAWPRLQVVQYLPGEVVHLPGEESIGIMIVNYGRLQGYLAPDGFEEARKETNLKYLGKNVKQDIRVINNLNLLENQGLDPFRRKFLNYKDAKRDHAQDPVKEAELENLAATLGGFKSIKPLKYGKRKQGGPGGQILALGPNCARSTYYMERQIFLNEDLPKQNAGFGVFREYTAGDLIGEVEHYTGRYYHTLYCIEPTELLILEPYVFNKYCIRSSLHKLLTRIENISKFEVHERSAVRLAELMLLFGEIRINSIGNQLESNRAYFIEKGEAVAKSSPIHYKKLLEIDPTAESPSELMIQPNGLQYRSSSIMPPDPILNVFTKSTIFIIPNSQIRIKSRIPVTVNAVSVSSVYLHTVTLNNDLLTIIAKREYDLSSSIKEIRKNLMEKYEKRVEMTIDLEEKLLKKEISTKDRMKGYKRSGKDRVEEIKQEDKIISFMDKFTRSSINTTLMKNRIMVERQLEKDNPDFRQHQEAANHLSLNHFSSSQQADFKDDTTEPPVDDNALIEEISNNIASLKDISRQRLLGVKSRSKKYMEKLKETSALNFSYKHVRFGSLDRIYEKTMNDRKDGKTKEPPQVMFGKRIGSSKPCFFEVKRKNKRTNNFGLSSFVLKGQSSTEKLKDPKTQSQSSLYNPSLNQEFSKQDLFPQELSTSTPPMKQVRETSVANMSKTTLTIGFKSAAKPQENELEIEEKGINKMYKQKYGYRLTSRVFSMPNIVWR